MNIDDRHISLEEYNFYINNKHLNKNKFPSNYIRSSKYTLISFLPLNLFEQFQRAANLFFLALILLQLIPGVSPYTSFFVTILPIITILSITAIKEAIQDYFRHKKDNKMNSKVVGCYDGKEFINIYSKDLIVGDIIKIHNGDELPCDVVLLSSSEEDGNAYINTANLDGETNLKQRQSLDVTQSEHNIYLKSTDNYVVCDLPNSEFNTFNGLFFYGKGKLISLSIKQFIPHGSILSETKYIHGLVTYTGFNTKLIQNYNKPILKKSKIELVLNKIVLIMVVILAVLTIFSSCANTIDYPSISPYKSRFRNNVGNFFRNLVLFLILYSFLIPMSVYVGVEMSRLLMAQFIQWDNYFHVNGSGGSCNTSNLTDELGQIQFILTDKTGTLTENNLTVKNFYVNDQEIEIPSHEKTFLSSGQNFIENNISQLEENSNLFNFLLCLSICNDIFPCHVEQTLSYRSESTDEIALSRIMDFFHWSMVSRNTKVIKIKNHRGEIHEYEILSTLPFDSNLKRMSMLVMDEGGRIYLLTKGADSQLMRLANAKSVCKSLLVINNNQYKKFTKSRIQEKCHEYSKYGYRTLVFGIKELSREDYDDFLHQLASSNHRLHDRKTVMEKCFEFIENGIDLLGITGIEDTLFDDIPETVKDIKEAGIQIAMVTGDKIETAVNIGYNCNIISDTHHLIYLIDGDDNCIGNKIRQYLEEMAHNKLSDYSLILTGDVLDIIFRGCRKKFSKLFSKCKGYIFCRMSPRQKSLIAEFIKVDIHKVCLSIGDGGNDVSMLLSANVGVGIAGKEGTQASLNGDYVLQRFTHLKRLLFVHGRYNYFRLAYLLIFAFFNNISFNFAQFFFTFMNRYSGQSIYPDVILTFYNTLFSGPLFFNFGFFYKDIPQEELMKNPKYYRHLIQYPYFKPRTFFSWMACSLIVAIIGFTFPLGFINANHDVMIGYRNGGLYMLGVAIVSNIIIGNIFVSSLTIKIWDAPTIFLHFVGLIIFFIICIVSNSSSISIFGISLIGVISYICRSSYWMVLFLCISLSIFTSLIIGHASSYLRRFSKNNILDKLFA